jgi:hypothetical protein
MAYKAQPMTLERFAKAKELQLQIEKYGPVPHRTFFYLTDLIAEVERLQGELRKR